MTHWWLKQIQLKILRNWQYALEVYEGDYIKIPKGDIIKELKRRGKKI